MNRISLYFLTLFSDHRFMNRFFNGLFNCLVIATLFVSLFVHGFAFAKTNDFYIRDIRVDGLQRVPARTVFSALPLNVGDKVDPLRISQSINILFQTGNFEDIEIGRDGDVLVVVVKERPSIDTIEIEGNKTLETEALMKGMSQAGLVEGEVFRRNVMEHMQQELNRLYVAQGRYGARIDAEVTEQTANRVSLKITIFEGDVASIRQVKVVGNSVFKEQELLDQFELKKPHFTTVFKKDDRYAREKLVGDIESLRSYYLDRGYIKMGVNSTEVSVTPDKQKVYITVNVDEGDQYTVKEVKLAGRLVVPKAELESLIVMREGKVFSHRDLTVTNEFISQYIGNEGYMFSRVNGIPEVNEEDKTVNVTFFVDPGKRTYVRRINFEGNERTEDSVLRREMRQMEGAWASGAKIEQSKTRLDRLGFFKGVKVETVRVPGETDQVDVNYVVEESSFGEIGASLSYQASVGASVSIYQKHNNFLGTGNKLGFNFEKSDYRKSFSFNYVDPYYTVDGVTRGFDVFFTETDISEQSGLSSSSSITDERGFNLTFGYPISEIARLNFSMGIKQTDIRIVLPFGASIIELDEFFAEEGNELDAYNLAGGWVRSTLNKSPFASLGTEQRLRLLFTAPSISDVEYYTLRYTTDYYKPLIGRDWIFHVNTDFAYGAGYGDSSKLPYYENFYAGGIGSVRGYRVRSLGNKNNLYSPAGNPANDGLFVEDENGDIIFTGPVGAQGNKIYPEGDVSEFQSFGGNLKTEASIELIVPTPFVKDDRMLRTSIFFDAGNVFDTARGYEPTFDKLRYSVGASLTWITPLAPLSFIYAIPVDQKPGDSARRFEFQLGTVF
jgi:outer membrane protein insertion porin family